MDRLGRYLKAKTGRRPHESRVCHRVRLASVSGLAAWGLLSLTVAADILPQTGPSRYERRANDLLKVAPHSQSTLRRAEILTRAGLEQRPLDGGAWLRLAYISSLRDGELKGSANEAIVRSYDLEPLGPEITLWRIAFILDHWSSATPQVRDLALSEIRGTHSKTGWDVEALAKTVKDPGGRMVATILTRRLRQQPAAV